MYVTSGVGNTHLTGKKKTKKKPKTFFAKNVQIFGGPFSGFSGKKGCVCLRVGLLFSGVFTSDFLPKTEVMFHQVASKQRPD